MSDEHKRYSFAQTVSVGAGHPVTVTAMLVLCSVLLGANMWGMFLQERSAEARAQQQQEQFRLQVEQIRDSIKDANKEVRILGIHVQDMNAIMLREGLVKPGDKLDPTSGTH